MGVSVQLFETVGWAQEIQEAATVANVRRLPRVYTAAAWGCFTGRPEQAVIAAQTASRLETDPRYEPCEPGLSGLIEALAQVYAGHLDRYVEVATEVVTLPGNARGWGLPLLVDGLQATGRISEAIELTDAAVAARASWRTPLRRVLAVDRGGAFATTDPSRALAVWREALDYVHEHRVNFFVGFIARDAARLHLVDADPDDSLTMFDAAIDSFQQVGNVVQLTITLASATSLFERIDRPEQATTLLGGIVRQPGGDQHVPELPVLAGRLATQLGDAVYRQHEARGAAMDLNELAHYAAAADPARPRPSAGPGGDPAITGRWVEPPGDRRAAAGRPGTHHARDRRAARASPPRPPTATCRTSTPRSACRTGPERRSGRRSTTSSTERPSSEYRTCPLRRFRASSRAGNGENSGCGATSVGARSRWFIHRHRRGAHDEHCHAVGRVRGRDPMILATTQIEEFDRFLDDLRHQGRREARPARLARARRCSAIPNEHDRVWVALRLGRAGLAELRVRPRRSRRSCKEAGHVGKPQAAQFHGAVPGLRRRVP